MKKIANKGRVKLSPEGDAVRVFHIEVTEAELQLYDRALKKEQTHLSRLWEKAEPKTPEEIMYRALVRDDVQQAREDIQKTLR